MANVNKKNWSMKWVVAKFTGTKDYSVLPINWLVVNENEKLATSTIKFCKWPPIRTVTSDDLKKAIKPNDTWSQYQIKILGGNKTYENFGKAWHIQVVTSDNEEQVAKKRCRTPDTDTTDDEDIGFVIAPVISNSLLIGSQDMNFMDDIPQLSTSPIYTDMSITEPQISVAKSKYSDMSLTTDHYSRETSSLEQVPNFEAYPNDFSTSQIVASSNEPSTSTRTYEGSITPRRRVKNIGCISNRQFKRRLKNELEIFNQTVDPIKVTKHFNEHKKVKPSNAEISLEPLFIEHLQEETLLPVMAARASYNDISKKVKPIFENKVITKEDLNQDLIKRLCKWAVNFNVSHGSANEILSILRSIGFKVPKDIRTILHEYKVNHPIIEIQNGSYLDIGILNIIKPHLVKQIQYIPNNMTIKLSFNIDGLPLAKSSKTQFWPILLSFTNLPIFVKKIFPVGIYHSYKSKPGNINEYFRPFIIELQNLLTCGIKIENKQINFEINHFVADAPAKKSFLLNVKNHNGYFSCNSCEVEGDYIERRVCFLDMSAPPRTNDSFRSKSNPEYHKDGLSPLIELPIDVTSTVVLDYMHCVCQGVMKRLLEFWIRGKKPVRIIEEKKSNISLSLFNLRKSVPSEFARLPRSLDDLEYWKATEFRQILLYTGVIVLKSNIKKEFYEHFLLLVVSIRILCSDQISDENNNLALKLLRQFVENYSSQYGPQFINYNVHSLIHLPFYAHLHGSLDNYSSFKYENYLQILKKSMKCCRYPLSEIQNKIFASEGEELMAVLTYDENNLIKSFKINENISNFGTIYYNQITLSSNNYVLSCSNPKDQCIILDDGNISIIKNIYKQNSKIDNTIKLTVVKILTISDLFIKPVPSRHVGIYLINTNHISSPYDIVLNTYLTPNLIIRSELK
ncbi:uncharacterized protein LOC132935284 [Metopolophium dirhodum]|uniref:uncharacterized protein LOC132935284 n=1 Tax=Metopolophium dirhodum TaxID=44670 RepID=UPI00299077C6|nr:uncharacterized protein LOC132935284 [Metopolophium dirhodum]